MSKYQRKAPKRQLRDRVLILCGGQTEEIYFNKFKEKHKDGRGLWKSAYPGQTRFAAL